jgi:acyl-CoA synthetase (AMP-forming)/AMP-acid ligase II
MMMIAGAVSRYSLRSLRTITYGTEPMPEATLAAARRAMPWLRFKQTYGLSELGILPTQSENSGSTWLKLGNDGFETRIVNNLLWIRARSAMLGYLNAPSPFDADGWLNTQDEVEIRGDYVRILGRRSEVINVGGEKVHPSEVESVVLTMDNIRDATVYGRANPVTGQIVCARVSLIGPEDIRDVKRRLRSFCAGRLAPYKIPALVEIVDGDQHNYRFKKMRDFGGTALGAAELGQ